MPKGTDGKNTPKNLSEDELMSAMSFTNNPTSAPTSTTNPNRAALFSGPQKPTNTEHDIRVMNPATWKKYAADQGWELVPSNAVYPSYKIPGKNYEIIKNGKKIRLPYETYMNPMQKPAIDPSRKPLDFNSNIGIYNPNTGTYKNTQTGQEIKPVVEVIKPKKVKDGGMIKGYDNGGGVKSAANVNKTTPVVPGTPNTGAGSVNTAGNAQKTIGQQSVATEQEQNLPRSNAFSLDNQNLAAAGLALGTNALSGYNAKQKGEMTYGSNAYFDKMNKQNATGDSILGVAGAGAAAVNPLLGAAVNAIPVLGDTISGADAYGVSDKGDARVMAGMILNQKDQIRSMGRGFKELGKGNIGRGLAYMTPVGGLIMNDERRYEREKLKAEGQQAENQAQYDRDVAEKNNQSKYNIANAMAMRNAGVTGYNSNVYTKDPVLKQAEFIAPGKNKTLTALGLAKGGAVKGGVIKGKGTAKSDSIDAQVKENSFVVPAENNHIAEELREKLLGDNPSTTAKVKQGTGPKVKLSNGEHLFTPEERMKLEKKGVDLYQLAPDSDDLKARRYMNGGMSKGYADGGGVGDSEYIKQQKAAIAAEKARNTQTMGLARANQIAQEKNQRLDAAIQKNLQQQTIERKKAEADFQASQKEFDNLKKAYEYSSKKGKTIGDYNQAVLGMYDYGTKDDKTPEQQLAKSELLLNNLEKSQKKLEDAKKRVDYTSNEGNYINTKNLTPYLSDMPQPATTRSSGANDPFGILAAGKGEKGYTQGADPYGVNKGKATPAKPIVTTQSPLNPNYKSDTGSKVTTTGGSKSTSKSAGNQTLSGYNPMMSDTFDPVAFANQNPGPSEEEMNRVSGQTTPPSNTSLVDEAESLKTKTPVMPDVNPVTGKTTPSTSRKFAWQDAANSAINYGIPLAQSIIGFNQLRKVGDRPVDKLDADLLDAMNATKTNVTEADLAARYGMSAEELAALRMQNNALTNAGRYAARNFSGGSGANALNMERSVINDSFDRALQTKVADKNLQMQKQQNAWNMQNAVNSLAQYKQEANRRLFADDLAAWQQKTDAAAGLMSTGLSNLSDASAADRRMREFKKMNSK